MQLYNFRSEASQEHQHWLVQVALAFCAQNVGCLVAHDSRLASKAVALAIMQAATPCIDPLLYLGQWSTPAVAFACCRLSLTAIVVTASHNAWEQIGLKFFDREGLPLSPTAEERLAQSAAADVPMSPIQPSSPSVYVSRPSVIQEYLQLLQNGTRSIMGINIAVEVGDTWRDTIQHWLPGLEVTGARRTDPSAEPPVETNTTFLFRLDEDLDKLVVWADGQEIPGQMLLLQWLLLRPVGTLCLSFDVTRFVQRCLIQRGYTVLTTPVGDQFVAHAMKEHNALTGGEPNGHYIAVERSFCPDALAASLDLLAGGEHRLFERWHTPAARYCRCILVPFPYSLEEATERLRTVLALYSFQPSYPLNTTALVVEDEKEEHRIILRLSRFEQVAVLQTEGKDAQRLFYVFAARFSDSSIQRRESWTE